jgi:hypothetical protein
MSQKLSKNYEKGRIIKKHLQNVKKSSIMSKNEYFRMKSAGKGNAAEGVTLSGFRKDEDCRSTELWRSSLN